MTPNSGLKIAVTDHALERASLRLRRSIGADQIVAEVEEAITAGRMSLYIPAEVVHGSNGDNSYRRGLGTTSYVEGADGAWWVIDAEDNAFVVVTVLVAPAGDARAV